MSNEQLTVTKPCKAPLRYYGSKWRIAQWIISHFPKHTHYVEPFGGGASILLSKAPVKLETYNDLDGSVVNFFKVLRDRPDELIRAIELTPFARSELNQSNEIFAQTGKLDPGRLDELERARLFYVRCNQGRSSGSSVWKVTWRWMLTDNRSRTMVSEWNDNRMLWETAARLKMIQIENLPALKVIKKYDTPDTLFYLDPPYTCSERGQGWLKAYQFELSDDEHRELAQALNHIHGMAIISGYPSQLYADLYEARGWQKETTMARTNNNKKKIEAIWINPLAQQRARQLRLLG